MFLSVLLVLQVHLLLYFAKRDTMSYGEKSGSGGYIDK